MVSHAPVRELVDPSGDCEPQNSPVLQLQILQILASLSAQMNPQIQADDTALPAPLQLQTDTNIFGASGLPNLQLHPDVLAALLRNQAEAVVSGPASGSTGSGSSAFSLVQAPVHQALSSAPTSAPALFKTQQNDITAAMSSPLSLALAQLLRAPPVAPTPAVATRTTAASSTVLPPSNCTAVGIAAPANMMASDFYIPHSLLPRDPATQETVMQERREKLRRFQAKKRGRGAPSVRYASRKKYADSRPRIKGRFVRKSVDDSGETTQ